MERKKYFELKLLQTPRGAQKRCIRSFEVNSKR
jgi:hypothetical protein